MVSKEEWSCMYCGRTEGEEPPHKEIHLMGDEITVDVTCSTVYFMRDDGYGVALDYDEFERVIKLYESAIEKRE